MRDARTTREGLFVTLLATALVGSGCFQSIDVGANVQQPVTNLGQNDAGREGWLDGGIIVPCGPECAPEAGGPPACAGDLLIGTQQEWDAFIALGCLHFSGSLSFRPDGPIPVLTNDVLQTVSGNLRVVASPVTLGFAALTTVGGTLDLALNTHLSEVKLPALESVGGLNVLGSASLLSLELPSLKTVRTIANIHGNALRTLNLPALEWIRGNGLFIFDNPALVTLALPSLSAPGFEFVVRDNVALTTLSLPALRASESIAVGGNTALTSLDAPWLTTVNGDLLIQQNASLTTLGLPALTTVTQKLDVSNNPQLRACLVDELRGQLTGGPATFSASGNDGAPNLCP